MPGNAPVALSIAPSRYESDAEARVDIKADEGHYGLRRFGTRNSDTRRARL